ncbi:hypothetical protein [Pseudomonas mediterranea]
MVLPLSAVNCPTTHKKLQGDLLLLYKRLGEIAKGNRTFGGFIAHGDLPEKFYLKVENYPQLMLNFTSADCDALTSYSGMGKNDLLACAKTPLERLMIATLWKQGDLGKIKYIAAGIVEHADAIRSNLTESSAPVFRQFGRHLAKPESEPMADQHSLRAYRYLLGQDLADSRHRWDTVKAEEVKNYVKWVQALFNCDSSSVCIYRMYEFDRSMFALGKATKFFINTVVPSAEKKNNSAAQGRERL